MERADIGSRLARTLERGERVVWTGASSRWAHVASHVPTTVFAAAFLLIACGTTITRILRVDFSIGMVNALLLAVATLMVVGSIRSVVRDLSVGWAVTDRAIHRVARRGAVSTDVRGAVAVEMVERRDGRGDIVVRMPERLDVEGARRYPSVRMLDVGDVDGARRAIASMRDTGATITQRDPVPGRPRLLT